VIDVEPLIARELGRLVPEPAEHRADWGDVARRAGMLPSRRRRLVLTFAILAAVFVTAAAVATTLGGFDTWLSGTPGKPASQEAQQRFEAANGRSWTAFPKSTKLRELIRTKAGGASYVLYGFRSGNSLCLQLAAEEFAWQPKACAPAAFVAGISAPVVVAVGDYVFYDRGAQPAAQVSFGIVADGISRVDVEAVDSSHRARVGGNAYLYVQAVPNSPNRVLHVSALADGRRTSVPVRSFGAPLLSPATASGPTKLEARIANPRIGWYDRGERRGIDVDDVNLTAREQAWFRGARVVKPDPLSDFVVGISGHGCIVTTQTKNCGPGFFWQGPLRVGMNSGFGQEFMTVFGAAADGVARVTIFLADGERLRAPLRDNFFAAVVPTAGYPLRVVGYDTRGRVVAIHAGLDVRLNPVVPAKARRLRRVDVVVGPNGARAALDAGPVIRSIQCSRLRAGAIVRDQCAHDFPSLPVEVLLVQPVGRDIFLAGRVGESIARVDLELPLRHRIASVRPVAGHYLLAVPREYLGRERRHAHVVGFDRAGQRVARVGVFYRLR
jgi:hypothetical protein